jgi:hypothetical protein
MQGRLSFAKTGIIALFLSMTAQSSLHADTAAATVGSDPEQLHGADAESMELRANGNWGWGRSEDLELAKAIARGYCNDNSCQYIFWTQNACAVLAVGSDRGYGWAWNTDRLAAVQNALQNCSNFASSCKVVLNECT